MKKKKNLDKIYNRYHCKITFFVNVGDDSKLANLESKIDRKRRLTYKRMHESGGNYCLECEANVKIISVANKNVFKHVMKNLTRYFEGLNPDFWEINEIKGVNNGFYCFAK